MILYLSRNENSSLLDMVADERSLHIHKLSGNFCLSEFVVRDMRKYAGCRYFCVERTAVAETDSEFLEALQSLQMISDARIIVIYENTGGTDDFIKELVRIGITDIVTADNMAEKAAQAAECLSAGGMLKYKPAVARPKEPETTADTETLAQGIVLKDLGDEQYRFDCVNVRIGVIGATRRVGTTTLAFGLVNFIRNHGGTACYVALNENRHLESIAEAYGFDMEEDYYTYDAIDFYESMLPKYDYNFTVFDFGDIYNGDIKREAVKGFKGCEVHLLCGACGWLYEIVELSEGLKAVKSVKPQILTYEMNPDYEKLFRSAVTKGSMFIRPVENMMDYNTNAVVLRKAVEKYIVETSKRL